MSALQDFKTDFSLMQELGNTKSFDMDTSPTPNYNLPKISLGENTEFFIKNSAKEVIKFRLSTNTKRLEGKANQIESLAHTQGPQ